MERCLCKALLPLLVLAASPALADWPGILGPERNGRTAEPLPAAFPADGPPVLWRHGVGEGMAGVAVAGERVVVFHRPGDVERVEALSVKDGSALWRSDVPATYRGGILPDSGPRAVPAVHGDSVVTLGAGGLLRVVSLADGAERWSADLASKYAAPEGYFGFGASPLVVSGGEKELVIANAGGSAREQGPGAGILAFDLSNGKEAWRAVDDRASYSSPVVATLGGRRQVVVATRLHVAGLDPANGRELWRVPFGQRGPSAVGALPVEAGGRLLLTAAYGVGARLLDFSRGEPTAAWSGDQLSSHYPTPLVIGGQIFGIDGREDHGTGQLRALELSTGEVLWTEKRYGMAHLISDGERILAQRLDGSLHLIAADSKRFRRLGAADVAEGPVRAIPAYSRGVLYLRTTPPRGGGEVVALRLR